MEHGCRCKTDDHGNIAVAVRQQEITGSENSGDGRQIQACQYKNNDTDDQSNDNKLGHAFFGCFVLPFPHIAADDGIASGSKHGSDSKDDINDRVDNI